MPVSYRIKAPRKGAFFVGRMLLCALLAAALLVVAPARGAGCALPSGADEEAEVGFVFDGDTVQLRDGRHVRLLGINTPEEGHGRRRAEPHAAAATAALRALLGPRARVRLVYGNERRDHYGRTLAHLYLEDGRNVQAWMLEQGHAMVIAVPPNLAMLDCYRQAERRAREAGRGLWGLAAYRPLAAETLTLQQLGFHRVQGRIVRVVAGRESWWLKFAGGAALRIARDDLGHFPGLKPASLQGQRVRARGWLYAYRGRPVMQLRHAAMFEVLGEGDGAGLRTGLARHHVHDGALAPVFSVAHDIGKGILESQHPVITKGLP